MNDYPVKLTATPPQRYARSQLGLRLVLFIALGLLGTSFGVLLCALYLLLPAFAAITLSNESAERFLGRDAPRVIKVLHWITAVLAYFSLVTDRFPTTEPGTDVTLDITPSGQPNPTSALVRIVMGLPSALGLAVLLFVSALVWLVASVSILLDERYPAPLHEFQVGVLRWIARLLAYQASIVDPYPPFSLREGTAPPVAGNA